MHNMTHQQNSMVDGKSGSNDGEDVKSTEPGPKAMASSDNAMVTYPDSGSLRSSQTSINSTHQVNAYRSNHHGEDEDEDDDELEAADDPVSINTPAVSRYGLNVPASRHSSRLSRSSSRVPVSQRTGLLAFLTLVPEYYNPREYKKNVKYILVVVVAIAAITGPMGTSIMLPAIHDIVDELDTSTSIVNVSVGIYLLSLGIFPLWWSSFSERHGRRSVYIISNIIFFAFTLGSALSPNIAGLIILRFLSGCGGSAVQSVGAGTIGDLFAPHERGAAMGVYYLGPLLGPFLSPIIGGAVSQAFGWRATMYTLVIFIGVSLILIITVLPETCKTGLHVREAIREHLDNENLLDEKNDDFVQPNDPEAAYSANGKVEHHPVSSRNSQHSYTEADVERIASNLSRQNSRSQKSYLDLDEDYELAVDPVMPTISRRASNVSNVPKGHQDQRFHHQLDQLNHDVSQDEKPQSKDEVSGSDSNTLKLGVFVYDYLIRPTHSVVLLTYPPVLLTITYSSICFALVYFFNMTISLEYARAPYNFSSIIIGLMYIPNSVTYFIGSIFGGRWTDHLLNKYSKSHNGEIVPESRISWNIVVAVVLYPPACLIFGWCLKFGEHWVTPLIGTALFGFASMLVIGTTVTYLVDILPGKGATGVALNNLCRQILAAIATFIAEPLLNALGAGILFSILMGIMLVATGAIIFLKRSGQAFRGKYDLDLYYEKL